MARCLVCCETFALASKNGRILNIFIKTYRCLASDAFYVLEYDLVGHLLKVVHDQDVNEEVNGEAPWNI